LWDAVEQRAHRVPLRSELAHAIPDTVGQLDLDHLGTGCIARYSVSTAVGVLYANGPGFRDESRAEPSGIAFAASMRRRTHPTQ
jgi:hypothetical protein